MRDTRLTMTRSEFEAQRAELCCQACGHVGLEAFSANGGLVGARCPACNSKLPLPGIQWLPKADAKKTPRRASDTRDVWALNGDHCSFCGKSWDLCVRLHINRTAQHVHPVCFGGETSVLVPFCARCQEASAAALKETQNLLGELDTLDAIIRRIEAKNPWLL